MAKTITLRMEDELYEMFKKAAAGERRTISNFIEYAALAYLTEEVHVSEDEMSEILGDKNLIQSLKAGLADAAKGKYKVVG